MPVVPVARFWSTREGLARRDLVRGLETGRLPGFRGLIVVESLADALARTLDIEIHPDVAARRPRARCGASCARGGLGPRAGLATRAGPARPPPRRRLARRQRPHPRQRRLAALGAAAGGRGRWLGPGTHLGARRRRRCLHRPRRLRHRRAQGQGRGLPLRWRDRARHRARLLRPGLRRQPRAAVRPDRGSGCRAAPVPGRRSRHRQPRDADDRGLGLPLVRSALLGSARPHPHLHACRHRLAVAGQQPHQGLRDRGHPRHAAHPAPARPRLRRRWRRPRAGSPRELPRRGRDVGGPHPLRGRRPGGLGGSRDEWRHALPRPLPRARHQGRRLAGPTSSSSCPTGAWSTRASRCPPCAGMPRAG